MLYWGLTCWDLFKKKKTNATRERFLPLETLLILGKPQDRREKHFIDIISRVCLKVQRSVKISR